MSRVLVISPHPDDEAIGCGGTIRKHVVEGDRVDIVFLTSGEAGGHGTLPELTAKIREAEARSSASILGVESVEFWRLCDGAIAPTDLLVARMAALISMVDRVYVPHSAEQHADHQAAWLLALKAVDTNGQDRSKLRGYEVWTPIQNILELVDISPYLDVKLEAIRAHASQCSVMRFDEAIQGLARYRGEMHSWPGGDYAEVFTGTA